MEINIKYRKIRHRGTQCGSLTEDSAPMTRRSLVIGRVISPLGRDISPNCSRNWPTLHFELYITLDKSVHQINKCK